MDIDIPFDSSCRQLLADLQLFGLSCPKVVTNLLYTNRRRAGRRAGPAPQGSGLRVRGLRMLLPTSRWIHHDSQSSTQGMLLPSGRELIHMVCPYSSSSSSRGRTTLFNAEDSGHLVRPCSLQESSPVQRGKPVLSQCTRRASNFQAAESGLTL